MANEKHGYDRIGPVVVLSFSVQSRLLNPHISMIWCSNAQSTAAGMTASTDMCTAQQLRLVLRDVAMVSSAY